MEYLKKTDNFHSMPYEQAKTYMLKFIFRTARAFTIMTSHFILLNGILLEYYNETQNTHI
jgi:hypothetical protein